jgi:transposase
MRTSQKAAGIITTIGIDIGKNTFHLVGLDKRGAITLQQKVSRGQLERRLANIPRCLISVLQRAAGPYILARLRHRAAAVGVPLIGAKRKCGG